MSKKEKVLPRVKGVKDFEKGKIYFQIIGRALAPLMTGGKDLVDKNDLIFFYPVKKESDDDWIGMIWYNAHTKPMKDRFPAPWREDFFEVTAEIVAMIGRELNMTFDPHVFDPFVDKWESLPWEHHGF